MTELKNKETLDKLLKENPLLHKTIDGLCGLKVKEPVLLDLSDIRDVLDEYLIICTCQSETQMRSVLNHIRKTLSRLGVESIRSEYSPGAKWGILYCSELILHVFEQQTRLFYSLERMWGEAKAYPISVKVSTLPQEENTDEYI